VYVLCGPFTFRQLFSPKVISASSRLRIRVAELARVPKSRKSCDFRYPRIKPGRRTSQPLATTCRHAENRRAYASRSPLGMQLRGSLRLPERRISRHRQTNRHAYQSSKAKFRTDLPFFKRLWTKDDSRAMGTSMAQRAGEINPESDFSRPSGTPIIRRPRAARLI
jgi:hypothetical protein